MSKKMEILPTFYIPYRIGKAALKNGIPDLNRKRAYLSGKISGLLHIEYVANFDYASIEAEYLGYIPVNPVRIYDGKDWCWLRFMIADLALLALCEAIYLQKNWRDSRGAKIERAFARMLRKEIVYQ